jgi:hypothetical protein
MGLGLVPLLGGLLGLLNSVRMAVILRHHRWRPSPVQYLEVRILNTPNGIPTLFMGDDSPSVMTLIAFKWRWRRFQEIPEVWFAGSPGRAGVVSTPGGTYFVWAHRPWTPVLKRRLLKARRETAGSQGGQSDQSWLGTTGEPQVRHPARPTGHKDSFSDLASRLRAAVDQNRPDTERTQRTGD